MPLTNSINSAMELVDLIAKELWNLPIPASIRSRSVSGCFAVTQEHHHAIVILFQSNLSSSAFALMRPEYEAYIRGVWLANCATDDEVEQFSTGAEPPRIGILLTAIEKIPAFDEKHLSEIKSKHWSAMCSYTHTGSLQVQRWNTEEAIEPNFSPEESQEVLKFAGIFSLLSTVGIASLAENEIIANNSLEKMRKYTE